MLCVTRHGGLRVLKPPSSVVFFGSSSPAYFSQVKPRIELDPALRDLLRDVDMSLGGNKRSRVHQLPPAKQLEEFPYAIPEFEVSGTVTVSEQNNSDPLSVEAQDDETAGRKSPAAEFGSHSLGAMILPLELQNSINLLISEGDKRQLRSDAQRLFRDRDEEGRFQDSWDADYDMKYPTRARARELSERDGSAFASVALPAHFSVITAVFDHVKRRLGPEWRAERIMDWGAGTGSGLWSGAYAFQDPLTPEEHKGQVDLLISNTTIRHYLGIDKRDGLVTVAKRLLRDIDHGPLRVSWHKSFREGDTISRSDGHQTVALSAFMLTSLPTSVARKALIKEMWSSGAHVLVIIDHNTKQGFEAVAEARDYLLKVGRKEFDDPEAADWDIRGSHVVAPCPHDRACPLHFPGDIQLICGFSQRLQRPSFVRHTKHSGTGHEDMEYSYVVIRRGPRPSDPGTTVGRLGRIGRAALEKELQMNMPIKELFLHNEDELAQPVEPLAEEPEDGGAIDAPLSPTALDAALRVEAYRWPRLIFPPLKRSGHIILDACTPEGKIMRMTVPRSQGKQPFYDARKSGWGDIFPHPPKNPPQERCQPQQAQGKRRPAKGSDIGKRGGKEKVKGINYESIATELKARRKNSRRDKIAYKERSLWGAEIEAD